MQPKILALSGRGGSWKSATIRLAYEQLCNEPGVNVEWYEPIGRLLYFIAVARIGNQRVGFANRGDLKEWLEESLTRLRAESCAVIVCSVRRRGGTRQTLMDLQSSCSVALFEEQACGEPERSRLNRAMAEFINVQIKLALAG